MECWSYICPICCKYVEDEIHFLLVCDAYSEQREKLFRKANEFDNKFDQKDDIEKFAVLMSNLQKYVIKYLTKAIAIRTNALTISNRD